VHSGIARVTVLFNGRHETFLLNPGDVFYSPVGYFHYFEKVSDGTDFVMFACFNTDALSTFDTTPVFGQIRALTPNALTHTFGVSPAVIASLFAHDPGQPKYVNM
jgi:oxalate decarboxylase/phosphoglucose isomerase-like protein (cupin superfamily)